MLKYPEFWNNFSILSILLYPLSLIFKLGTATRKAFSVMTKLEAPIICIGNISVGGSGKTPLIKEVAKFFLKKSLKVVIVSKGYPLNITTPILVSSKCDPASVGDEPLELYNALSDYDNFDLLASSNFINTIDIIKRIRPALVLVDDFFQNTTFYKDVKILTVDGERGFGNEFIIPAGPLRQTIHSGIEEADIVVSINPNAKIDAKLSGSVKYIKITATLDLNVHSDDKLFAFCAIGNPSKLLSELKKKHNLVGNMIFQDHHHYTTKDIQAIILAAKKTGATTLVTTEKDAQKIDINLMNFPVKICRLEFNQKDILNLIDNILKKLPSTIIRS
ncbi:MAG: tetraacyldisaccharide 4'-kinase [Rickettsiaceae bacterium]|nr:tetraacyldisaccharide 4'-kinase [Rickettsiaceae bacterium]